MTRTFFLLSLLALTACPTKDDGDDTDTDTDTDGSDTDTDGVDTDTDTDDMDMNAMLRQAACDAAGMAGMAVTAAETVDAETIPTLHHGMAHTVTLPSSGTGFVAIDNDTHRDFLFFLDEDAAVTLHDGGGGSTDVTGVMATPECTSDLPAMFTHHLHPITWILELEGDAGGDVWIYAVPTDGGGHGGHDTDTDTDTDAMGHDTDTDTDMHGHP